MADISSNCSPVPTSSTDPHAPPLAITPTASGRVEVWRSGRFGAVRRDLGQMPGSVGIDTGTALSRSFVMDRRMSFWGPR
jgi:hypothetical protein